MTLAQIRALFRPGQVVTVTNHYLTRADHPCFGTHPRTVQRVTSTGLWLDTGGRVAWPKAPEISVRDCGTTYDVHFYGGGIGQQPTDAFLTITLDKAGA